MIVKCVVSWHKAYLRLPIITNKSFFVKFKILQEFGIWLFLLDANLMWCFDMDVIGRGRKNGETLNL